MIESGLRMSCCYADHVGFQLLEFAYFRSIGCAVQVSRFAALRRAVCPHSCNGLRRRVTVSCVRCCPGGSRKFPAAALTIRACYEAFN